MIRVAFLGDLLKNTSHFVWNATLERMKNIGTHSVRELFCSCQEEVRKWLLNERACTKVHYWDVYLSSVEHSKSTGF